MSCSTLSLLALTRRLTMTDTFASTTSRPQLSMSTLNAVIFRNHAAESAGKKFLSLFPGLGYAAGYKILQRVYKCGPRPVAPLFISLNADAALLFPPGLEDSRTPTTT